MDQVAVITGGADVGAAFAALSFDHLLFTGSGATGRLIMRAASENLVPVTLEPGGKSPALIDADYPLERAARSIAQGKLSASAHRSRPATAIPPNRSNSRP